MPSLVETRLQQKQLDNLKQNMVTGMFEDQDRKKKLLEARKIIKNALFLSQDENRKKRWLSVVDEFDTEFLDELIQAIIRENFRYKKKERNINTQLNSQLLSFVPSGI